jgi:hypothetical protein
VVKGFRLSYAVDIVTSYCVVVKDLDSFPSVGTDDLSKNLQGFVDSYQFPLVTGSMFS